MLEILTNKKDRKSGGWPLFLLSCYFKWYIAVPAYHVDLLRRPDDRAAYRADVLDAPVLAGLASSPDGGRGFLTAFVAVALGLDLEQGFAAGSNILHAGLLGQPRRRFRGQRRDRPAVGGVLHNSYRCFYKPPKSKDYKSRSNIKRSLFKCFSNRNTRKTLYHTIRRCPNKKHQDSRNSRRNSYLKTL